MKTETTNEKKTKNNTVKNIHSGHRARMREKFLRCGMDAFADHEILEMLLYYTNRYKDTNPIAHRLIREFGNLDKVLKADKEYLTEIEGVGEETAFFINMIQQLREHMDENIHTYSDEVITLHDFDMSGRYCCKYFANKTRERLIAILLNAQKQIIKVCVISDGTVDRTAMYSREIVELALKHRACSVILAHNHPGNNPNPSGEDINATASVDKALNSMDIVLVDHFICCGNNYISMRSRGLV